MFHKIPSQHTPEILKFTPTQLNILLLLLYNIKDQIKCSADIYVPPTHNQPLKSFFFKKAIEFKYSHYLQIEFHS
jgi:hypothetical protein